LAAPQEYHTDRKSFDVALEKQQVFEGMILVMQNGTVGGRKQDIEVFVDHIQIQIKQVT